MIFVNSNNEYAVAVFCELDDSDEPSVIVTYKDHEEIDWKQFVCPACKGGRHNHCYQLIYNHWRTRRLQEEKIGAKNGPA